MLSLEDLKGKKIKKHWSSFDVLVEVASVAIQKLELEEECSTKRVNIRQPSSVQKNSPKKAPCCDESKAKEKILDKRPATKKKKIIDFGPNPPPKIPLQFENRIQQLNGQNIILLIQKPLYRSDICRSEGRFSMPRNQLKDKFLTEEEETLLNTHNGKHLLEIEAMLIDPSLKERPICLRKWDVGKKNSKNTSSFVLVKGWNSVVDENKLKIGDIAQLYSFRVGSSLLFSLVIVKRSEEEKEEEEEDEDDEEEEESGRGDIGASK